MTKTTQQPEERLDPGDFFSTIESYCAEFLVRLQEEGEGWRGRADLGAKFHLIALYLEQAAALLPDEKGGR